MKGFTNREWGRGRKATWFFGRLCLFPSPNWVSSITMGCGWRKPCEQQG